MKFLFFLTFIFYLVKLALTHNQPKENSQKSKKENKNLPGLHGNNKLNKKIQHRGKMNNFKKCQGEQKQQKPIGQNKKNQIKITPKFQHKHQVQNKPHFQIMKGNNKNQN